MEKTCFSIVVPVFNTERFLSEAIESVLKQTYPNWELLLINDGSTDRSREICLNYQKQHRHIRLLEHPGQVNKGVSASRNLGMKEARYEWLAFLDADDFWTENKLETEARIISEHNDLVLIYSNARMFDHPDPAFNARDYGSGKQGFSENPFLPNLKGIQIHLSNVVVNRKKIAQADVHFNEKLRFSEDTLFCHEALQFGNLYYLGETRSHYRFSPDSATATIPEPEQVSGRLVVYENLLTHCKTEFRSEISFELVNTGLERIWKYVLKYPATYRRIFAKSFKRVLRNRKVKPEHKFMAFFAPVLILFKFILKKITA